jgi:hypothetical protein
MNGSQTPRDRVESWIKIHQNRIGTLKKLHRVEEPGYSLTAWFETPQYLIDICAWDHACCLDIEALNIATEKTEFCVTGPCESGAALNQRLENFLQWMELKKNA